MRCEELLTHLSQKPRHSGRDHSGGTIGVESVLLPSSRDENGGKAFGESVLQRLIVFYFASF